MENYKEQCRETRRFHGIHGFFADLRFGFRMLWRSPSFSILAILCLTLGIGANAAVLSWIEGILFRPYPAVAHQERLFAVTGMARGETDASGFSWPDFLDLQRRCTLVDSFIVTKITGTTLSIGDRAEVSTVSRSSRRSEPEEDTAPASPRSNCVEHQSHHTTGLVGDDCTRSARKGTETRRDAQWWACERLLFRPRTRTFATRFLPGEHTN